MKRRTLDIIFSVGGVLVAVLLLVLALVLRNNESFAKDYVHKELAAQQIKFKAADKLTAEEKASPVGACLTSYAGQDLVTGKQAECYAGVIGVHMAASAKSAGYEGFTYASLGTPISDFNTQIAAAKKANDSTLAASLQTKVDALNKLRVDTMFRGETLRGMLLTSYGFSEFGRKAAQAATVTFLAFILMLVLSAAGFVHYFAAAHRDVRAREESTALAGSHA